MDSVSLLKEPGTHLSEVHVRLGAETLRKTREKGPPLMVLDGFSGTNRDSSPLIEAPAPATHPPSTRRKPRTTLNRRLVRNTG